MAIVSMKQLLEAGVHFGHQTRRWNPKMAPYIYTERIYIIDLQKTVKKLEEAYSFVRELAANGESLLFVGTKKQAQDASPVGYCDLTNGSDPAVEYDIKRRAARGRTARRKIYDEGSHTIRRAPT